MNSAPDNIVSCLFFSTFVTSNSYVYTVVVSSFVSLLSATYGLLLYVKYAVLLFPALPTTVLSSFANVAVYSTIILSYAFISSYVNSSTKSTVWLPSGLVVFRFCVYSFPDVDPVVVSVPCSPVTFIEFGVNVNPSVKSSLIAKYFDVLVSMYCGTSATILNFIVSFVP